MADPTSVDLKSHGLKEYVGKGENEKAALEYMSRKKIRVLVMNEGLDTQALSSNLLNEKGIDYVSPLYYDASKKEDDIKDIFGYLITDNKIRIKPNDEKALNALLTLTPLTNGRDVGADIKVFELGKEVNKRYDIMKLVDYLNRSGSIKFATPSFVDLSYFRTESPVVIAAEKVAAEKAAAEKAAAEKAAAEKAAAEKAAAEKAAAEKAAAEKAAAEKAAAEAVASERNVADYSLTKDSPSNEFRVLSLETPRMQGEDVKAVQQALMDVGFPVQVDGIYGETTSKAVRKFQKAHDVGYVDGVVRLTTHRTLFEVRDQLRK